MSTTTHTVQTGLLAILAAAALTGCGSETSPGDSPTASVTVSPAATAKPAPESSPVPGVPEPAPTDGGLVVDLRPASEIPWDDVGPGWFILGYDPERSTPRDDVDGGHGWVLGDGETWLLSPGGVAYQGPQPPAGAEWISLWQGTNVWFAVPDWEDKSHPEQAAGDAVSVDALSGEQGNPWNPETLPQALEVTASGSLLHRESCCDSSDIYLYAPDGTATHIASGDHTGPNLESLTPDGTAFVYSDTYQGSSSVFVNDLATGRSTLVSIERTAYDVGWIDESTWLLDSYLLSDDGTPTDREFIAVDVTSGATTPWGGHIEDLEAVTGLAPGTWIWTGWDSWDAVVTNNDGSLRIELPCGGDYCRSLVSGDRMVWIEWWRQERPWSRIGQRVTLVDLETGRQTLIFEGGLPGGILIDIAPHAKTYP